MNRFSEKVHKALVEGGWFEGRSIDISEIESAMTAKEIEVFDAAREFWSEFEEIDVAWHWIDTTTGGGTMFDALECSNMSLFTLRRYIKQIGKPLCPIGEDFDLMTNYFIDPDGWIYAHNIDGKGVDLYSKSPEHFFNNLVEGRNAEWEWKNEPRRQPIMRTVSKLIAAIIKFFV